jgi:hypothetical protein
MTDLFARAREIDAATAQRLAQPHQCCECQGPAAWEYDYGERFYVCEECAPQGAFYGAIRKLTKPEGPRT